jgi:hypothetical protein
MSGDFRVVWNRQAGEIVLAEIVAGAFERGDSTMAITEAVHQIDHVLSRRPQECGESRPNHQRVLIVQPLTVFFEIHEDERLIYVLSVRYTAPRPRK